MPHRSAPALARPGLVALTSLALSLSLGACKKKDPEACNNAKNVIRQALSSEDFASARTWRDYAYKNCDDRSELDKLDKEIVDTEATVKKRKADEEAVKGRTDQLMKLFTEWASQHKANPAGAAVTVTCTPPADPKKETERWCTRERAAGEYKLHVRYWEAEPAAFEFSTIAPGAVTCDAFGSATQLRTAHNGSLVQCELGGMLGGAQGLAVRTAAGNMVSIYSPKLLEKDPAFQRRTTM